MALASRLAEAFLYAAELHGAQVRKLGGEPYVAHLLGVCSLVLAHGGDEDEAIAALLHDAVEDQGGAPTRDQIARRFGLRVAEIVDGCTDATVTPKPPWRQRKEEHLARLRAAPPAVRLVAGADKLDNARALLREHRLQGESLWDFFRGGRDGTRWYYRATVEVLRAGGDLPATPLGALIDELDQTVARLERLGAS
jgi:(p)ppGpp synthase/HD superfamily hydrolase